MTPENELVRTDCAQFGNTTEEKDVTSEVIQSHETVKCGDEGRQRERGVNL